MSETKGFLSQLLWLEQKDVTLKFLFDHIRNYGLAVVVFIGGTILWQDQAASYSSIPCLDKITGGLLCIVGFLLYVLNLCHIIWAMVVLKVRMLPYLLIAIFIFLCGGGFVWSLLQRGGLFA
ncbi:hypothetical protein ACW7G2_10790 [Luteimonas sp. A277]